MSNLIELTQAITLLQKNILSENERHTNTLTALNASLDAAVKERALLGAGLDLEKIRLAEEAFVFEGDPSKIVHGDYADQRRDDSRGSLISHAIRVLGETASAFAIEYFGIKNYASFGDQREDHKYGYGPKHGNIVFRIGLTQSQRDKEMPLTDAQREAGIYYLLNWKEIYKTRKAA